MFPVDVVQLDLYEIPFQFVVSGKEIIENFDVAVIRETEIADAPRFTFFQKEVEHAVIQIAAVQGFHAAHADTVQQQIIDIIHLQFTERAVIHGK